MSRQEGTSARLRASSVACHVSYSICVHTPALETAGTHVHACTHPMLMPMHIHMHTPCFCIPKPMLMHTPHAHRAFALPVHPQPPRLGPLPSSASSCHQVIWMLGGKHLLAFGGSVL